jgi:hypothetical protein
MAALDVEDRKPSVTEKDSPILIDKQALTVGATVCERSGHSQKVGAAAQPDEACDAAHQVGSAKLTRCRTL